MRVAGLANELADRGIWWQVGGFTVIGCASMAVLAEFAGSDSRAFLYFEIAATKLYWSFVLPLAGLFDGVRKMFEKASELRARTRERGIAEGILRGRRNERRRMRQALERFGVRDDASGVVTLNFTPEVLEFLFDESDESGE